MTDAELVARAQGGDEAAFRALVERYYADCWRYANAQLRGDADAEDAVQETFWNAYRSLASYREAGRFRHWLFSILVNKCRNALLSRARRERRFTSLDGDACEVVLDRRESFDELGRALDLIEPHVREAILLKYGEGMEYGEIAQLT